MAMAVSRVSKTEELVKKTSSCFDWLQSFVDLHILPVGLNSSFLCCFSLYMAMLENEEEA